MSLAAAVDYWNVLAQRAAALGAEVERTPLIWPPRRGIPQSRERWRLSMFLGQHGRCFWCKEDMDLARFKPRPTGGEKANDAFASFEHLIRREDGGKLSEDNIVLAHASCNRKRDAKNHLPRYAHDPYPKNRRRIPHAPRVEIMGRPVRADHERRENA